jgi:hypothetical protein
MTRVLSIAERPVQEILPFLQAIPVDDDPAVVPGATQFTVTFSTGLVSIATFDVIPPGVFDVTGGEVLSPGGERLLSTPDPDVQIDFEGNIVNLDEIEGLDGQLVDAPDRLDAEAWFELLEVIEALFLDAPLDRFLDSIRVDFGDEPEPEGPFDPADYDTLVLATDRAGITETVAEDGTVTIGTADAALEATGLERIEVSDGAYAYGLSEDAPFVYRLYAASLARTPDEAGLRFWDGAAEDGLRPLRLAKFFVDSQEFADNFLGDGSDEAYIDALYMNVLGREADEAGRDFWLEEFASGDQSRATMLIAFAESDENVALTAEDTDDGLWVV